MSGICQLILEKGDRFSEDRLGQWAAIAGWVHDDEKPSSWDTLK